MINKRVSPLVLTVLISVLVLRTPLVSAQTLETIEWHECVKTNAIFAWKTTDVDIPDEAMVDFLRDLLIQMKFIRNPPSDASRIFNATEPPNWFKVYINRFNIDLDQMGELGTAFTQLLSPISFQFDNGTSFTLEEIHRLVRPTGEFGPYVHVAGGYLNTTIGNASMRFTTFTGIVTGIARNISVVMGENGSFLMEYYAAAANVNEDGTFTELEEEYTNFQDNPLATYTRLIIAVGVGVVGLILIGVVSIRHRKHT